jgi:hypothetical protein
MARYESKGESNTDWGKALAIGATILAVIALFGGLELGDN